MQDAERPRLALGHVALTSPLTRVLRFTPVPRMAQPLHTASCGEVVEQAARDNAPSFLALLPHEIRDAVDEFARIPAWVWTGKLSAEPVARLPHMTMYGQESRSRRRAKFSLFTNTQMYITPCCARDTRAG